ncbi:divergent PAP2 family protein [Bhargavaea massiliensis]|uniref:divergent PAP2 family protein n=1 Tax=Bhargavaea massiliensis TaxID=2697500 RepID=UPI001BD042D0|nr:divergent PAP2 family protein [Bhargavaea massiliensis]
MAILHNAPLWVAIFSIFFAQFVKIPIHYLATRQVDWKLSTSTGGMPSSHSAAVSSLATAIGFEHGFDSSIFAVAAVFAIIVMFDASGVRFQAGQQAVVINQMRTDFRNFIQTTRDWPQKDEQQKIEELKTLLGHKPSEVYAGALTGILLSSLLYAFIL